MNLPNDLRLALAEELTAAAVPPKKLLEAVADLSQRYRAAIDPEVGSPAPVHEERFLQSKMDVVAYTAYRLPATFAAIYAALTQVRERRPQWHPQSLLDIGAGPGSAMWAAHEVWPKLEQVTLFEREEQMIVLGKQIAKRARTVALREAIWQRVDLTGKWENAPHDLVIAAYMLGEVPTSKREECINKLWASTIDTLVIVEPGTPSGFSRIRQARQQLLASGTNATTIAPCPHDLPCPLSENDWCHFAQRITRTPLHRDVKGATLSYEDEKFSYVAMSRTNGLPIAPLVPAKARVIRHPQIRPGHIYLELCTPEGLKTRIVTRKEREAFRRARDVRWGETFP